MAQGRKKGDIKSDEPYTTSRQSPLANPGNRLPPACRSGHRPGIQRLFYETNPKQSRGSKYETNPNSNSRVLEFLAFWTNEPNFKIELYAITSYMEIAYDQQPSKQDPKNEPKMPSQTDVRDLWNSIFPIKFTKQSQFLLWTLVSGIWTQKTKQTRNTKRTQNQQILFAARETLFVKTKPNLTYS